VNINTVSHRNTPSVGAMGEKRRVTGSCSRLESGWLQDVLMPKGEAHLNSRSRGKLGEFFPRNSSGVFKHGKEVSRGVKKEAKGFGLGVSSEGFSDRFSLIRRVNPSMISKILHRTKDTHVSIDKALRVSHESRQKTSGSNHHSKLKTHKRHSSFDQTEGEKLRDVRESINLGMRRSVRNLSADYTNRESIIAHSKTSFLANFSVRTRKGKSSSNPGKVNQDSFLTQLYFLGHSDCHLFGVYDGHGVNGHLVSNYIASNLPGVLKSEIQKSKGHIASKVLHLTYQSIFQGLTKSEIDVSYSGSTAVTCLIKGQLLMTANSGDSRAIVGFLDPKGRPNHMSLSKDHKPDTKAEAHRIHSSGGRIHPFKKINGKFYGPNRVWLANEDVPGLAMSRAVGDLVASSVGVTWRPEISEYPLSTYDKFIFVASDGVWEHLSNDDVAKVIWEYFRKNDIEGACDDLMKLCLKLWKKEKDDIDDITFVLVFLQ